MNVSRTAQTRLSGTMGAMIDRVCSDADLYPIKCLPKDYDRKSLFAKLRQLVRIMNRWFDICNSRDPKNPFALATKRTGPGYADELLEILAWFEAWHKWLRAQPVYNE